MPPTPVRRLPCPSLAVGSRGARPLDLSRLLLRQLFPLRVPLRARNEVGFCFASSAFFLDFLLLAASSSFPPGVRGEASPWWRGWDDDPTDCKKKRRRGESATLPPASGGPLRRLAPCRYSEQGGGPAELGPRFHSSSSSSLLFRFSFSSSSKNQKAMTERSRGLLSPSLVYPAWT